MTHPQLPDDEPSHTALGPRLPLLSTNQTRENVTFCGFGVSGVIIKKNDSPYFGAMIWFPLEHHSVNSQFSLVRHEHMV